MKTPLHLFVLLLVALAAQGALARTIVVQNTADGGPGSLRQALASASPGDTINITANGTITLTGGELNRGQEPDNSRARSARSH